MFIVIKAYNNPYLNTKVKTGKIYKASNIYFYVRLENSDNRNFNSYKNVFKGINVIFPS